MRKIDSGASSRASKRLRGAIYWAGGVSALAQRVAYTPGAVYYWQRVGRVPPKAAKRIEKASRGRFRAEEFARE